MTVSDIEKYRNGRVSTESSPILSTRVLPDSDSELTITGSLKLTRKSRPRPDSIEVEELPEPSTVPAAIEPARRLELVPGPLEPIETLDELFKADKPQVEHSAGLIVGREAAKKMSYIEQYGLLERRLRDVTPMHAISMGPKSRTVHPTNHDRQLHKDCCDGKRRRYKGQEWVGNKTPLAEANIYYNRGPQWSQQAASPAAMRIASFIAFIPALLLVALTVAVYMGVVEL